jgi:glycosyltransferase involved in cell wall biosynthesis
MGYVKDTKEFYSKIDFLIAPLCSGSGTRIKILESLSYGKPVITTNIGAEGLLIDSKLLHVANTPETMVKQLIDYVKSPSSSFNKTQLEVTLRPLLWEKLFTKYAKDIL